MKNFFKNHPRLRKPIFAFAAFFICAYLFLLFPGKVLAQNLNYKIPNPSKYNSLEEAINAGASLIRPAFLLTFGFFTMLSAITLITSRDSGVPERRQKAFQTFEASLIGLVIAIFAPTIVNFFLGLLGAEGLGLFGESN